ncbi:tRNA (5-methylaminomethyl-2-thiouridine)(34)-methyltransferase MnmD [Myroides marinus]|uniref:tRNA (5-methylaminomethyl-2-thiouridine)(34)-methyltransferase MnmD n=1 Tax=Myroides marinus TaxID=703342 RepID=UPI002578B7E0|nr:tRNA (5-methylaminomethyl-2-thiouridine)(34)-methyltransferase MnmD [Myroides marinus]MDM1353565.1 tRNA (5-methylaminomethyl-2-thiouridine)(34)-methyltransferase MnmD [Myroides marinus]MDM1378001.1 tRNA (5-methylaminomethyl-2-thiouridine)(34)-methyltransferase MnmD [Myroides marinus]MDM1385272.1 tRNA (5-methylaminomethyl-2-thiouridine)(34)-methyltransferase MnmD [Myroides marinus]MDM1392485.1 tRNA (5-methylaminomethyl-2-thiouridine)(34)-methyltransferase MnmD [Myroides marinus]
MKRKVITTSDGSTSIEMEDWGETYHSIHGAIQEARHVYIERGFDKINKPVIKVLEMGFGTGLNAFLTLVEARKQGKKVEYHSIEAFPVTEQESSALDFSALYSTKEDELLFKQMHQCSWNELNEITPNFNLHKIHITFEEAVVNQCFFDVVYFDVFGYQFQPDLWSVEIFKKVYDALDTTGVLVTYACRGPIKRAMKEVGFITEKVEGPPGKREMLVAYKL